MPSGKRRANPWPSSRTIISMCCVKAGEPCASARGRPTGPWTLTGKHWDKTRAALTRPQLWTYLDRAHEQLATLPVPAELRQAALRIEGTRRRPGVRAEGSAAGAAARALVLVASVVLSLSGAEGAAAVAAVR